MFLNNKSFKIRNLEKIYWNIIKYWKNLFNKKLKS